VTDDADGGGDTADHDPTAALPPSVTVERGDVATAEAVADLWVALADGQRAHGSHLASEPNREVAREEAARHAVTGGLFVARGRLEGPETVADEDPADGDVTAEPGDDDPLLGFATASVETPGFEQTVTRGLVHNIYVRPAARGNGIGGALLAAAETHLSEQGVDRVALEAMADNEAARRFYRRHGYTAHRVELEKRVGDR
jgi:ribosomal protein S18 acetylase RimI-like enzyme